MSEIKFTSDQELAIYAEGSDILVSAAAGSGKTAVLTRRVLNKITDTSQNADITDFLVVTFTVSAAADLKRKLSDGIRGEMRKNGADVSRLRRQLLSLSYAKIATIDSFCNFIVKDAAADLGLGAGMSLGDEAEIAALSDEIMNEIVEEFYSESSENDSFLLLAEAFSNARGDAALVPALSKIYSQLICHPCPMTIIPEHLEVLKEILSSKGSISLFSTPVFSALLDDIKERTCQALELFKAAKELCSGDGDAEICYLPTIESDIKYASVLTSFDSYRGFANLLDKDAPEKMKSVRGRGDDERLERIKALRKSGREIIKSLKSEYLVKDDEELYLQLELHIKILSAIQDVLSRFHARFMSEKKTRKIMSFSDMSHFAFDALVEAGSYDRKTGSFKKTPYAESLSARFSEILIDEYQDVNELQDLIFRAVSNSKNRFMVGDIKQSIYAFRGATPDIFKKYRDTFLPLESLDDKTETPKTVFLQNNFRSDSKILEFSNRLFSRLMNFDAKNYLEKDRLVYSRNDDAHLPVELVLLKEDKEREESLECKFVAEEIARLLKEGEYSPSDIAILARANPTLELIKAYLDKKAIPCDTTGEKSFFESYEILSLISILKAVANPLDDVSLAAALTMPPFSFTPDELLEIRGFSPKTDFYFALSKAAEENCSLGEKCRAFTSFLEREQEFAAENSAERAMWKIIEDTELFSELEKLDNSKGRKNNLIYLYSQAQTFCKKGSRSLGALCDFFDSLEKGGSLKGAKAKKENAVHLMTFHASKGLEFPVCFVVGLGHQLNKKDSFGQVVFSPFGPTFNLPYSETCTQLNSYLKKSASCLVKSSLVDEELRNLYVTLTRAEKKLYVTAECNIEALANTALNASLSESSFKYCVKRAASYISLIMCALGNDALSGKEYDSFRLSLIEEICTDNAEMTVQTECEKPLANFDEDALRFALSEIESGKNVSLPYKISVSEIKNGEFLKDDADVELIKAPQFILHTNTVPASFIGTSMHTFMQFCSFDIHTMDDCIREGARLVRDGFILPQHEKVLDYEKLLKIFQSPLFDSLRKSRLVEREKRYTLLTKASDILPSHNESTDADILVQGVVDCYFENEDKTITLIDFKTDRVSTKDGKEVLLSRHSEQLRLYANALREISGKKVSKIYIWSFALSEAIEVTV